MLLAYLLETLESLTLKMLGPVWSFGAILKVVSIQSVPLDTVPWSTLEFLLTHLKHLFTRDSAVAYEPANIQEYKPVLDIRLLGVDIEAFRAEQGDAFPYLESEA